MDKAAITTSINTIDNGGVNTAAEVRTVLGTLRDNSYATPVLEQYILGLPDHPNTTPIGTTHYYSLQFVKQGRTVSVNGFIQNKTGGIVSNENWFDIDAGEYTHDANNALFFGVSTTSGNSVRCKIEGTKLIVVGALGNNEVIEVNFQYNTLN
jgi:hypothetical protein